MQISKNQWGIALIGVVAVIALGAVWRFSQTGNTSVQNSPTATSSEVALTPTASSTQTASLYTFPINAADTITSWTFKGQYSGNDVLVKQANDDIALLTGLLGKGKYDDYDLYNGLGNDRSMLGEGKLAYENYNRSIRAQPNKGMAYVNLAHLMESLGAYYTAADAYTAGVKAESGELAYHVERLTFLTTRFATNNSMLTAAFADASKQFGDTAAILSIEAKWLTEQKRYADAIKAWETVRMLSSAERQVSIDAEIARLKAKQ